MEFLAHRGWWVDAAEKNSRRAFERALEAGYGIETDIRDFQGELVISHDIPVGSAMRCAEFFELYKRYESAPLLALNIKSDGLQAKLEALLAEYDVTNYFVFDMSVPDTIGYIRRGMNTYCRVSEYETDPPFAEEREGLWFDAFTAQEINFEQVCAALDRGESACLVSPELHGRNYNAVWKSWRDQLNRHQNLAGERLAICTDLPRDAQDFFGGSND
jgi:hypothetical protein